MTEAQDIAGARERLAEIAAAIEFASGDGFSFRESGAVLHASDLRALLCRERGPVEALERIATVDMGGGFLGALACRQVASAALTQHKEKTNG